MREVGVGCYLARVCVSASLPVLVSVSAFGYVSSQYSCTCVIYVLIVYVILCMFVCIACHPRQAVPIIHGVGVFVCSTQVVWIIYDEIHYMRDRERGVVWEESIVLGNPPSLFSVPPLSVPFRANPPSPSFSPPLYSSASLPCRRSLNI